jgi:hypothetical protein
VFKLGVGVRVREEVLCQPAPAKLTTFAPVSARPPRGIQRAGYGRPVARRDALLREGRELGPRSPAILEDQQTWSAPITVSRSVADAPTSNGSAPASGGAREGRARHSRIARTAARERIVAMMRKRPAQRGHFKTSTAKTRRIKSVQAVRSGRRQVNPVPGCISRGNGAGVPVLIACGRHHLVTSTCSRRQDAVLCRPRDYAELLRWDYQIPLISLNNATIVSLR